MMDLNSSLAASLVAKVTVVSGLGLLGAWMARGSRAAVRHALLAGAFAMMLLLPIASLVAPPVRIAIPVAAKDRGWLPTADSAMALPSALPARRSDRTAPPSAEFPVSGALMALWMAGTAICLLPMLMGLYQVRSLRRSGLPWLRGQSVADRLALAAGIGMRVEVLLHESLPGPMTCGVWQPAILLSPEAENWEAGDVNRAMVHELEHVRRGDWASLCLARAVCAAYWFHPLVWMASRRLELEAERACDDAVLRESEATAYADQLVGLARRLSGASKSPVPAMANRADLAVRVSAVLDSGQRRGRAGKLPLALAGAAAAVLVLAMTSLRIVASPQSAGQATQEFEAVSVKLVDPDSHGFHSHDKSDPGRLSWTASMHTFIVRAYDITSAQLSGEPDWFQTRLYSIEAVTAKATDQAQMMRMLRRVLTDRFELKLRQEDRDLPVYALEVAAGGPKFKPLKPGEEPRDPTQTPGMFARSFDSLGDLMNSLNGVNGGRLALDRPVVDRTHLAGNYDIQLQTEIQPDARDRNASQFPNLFHDIQSQLGLKLVSDRTRMAYFVVEHAAAPKPN